MTTNAPPRHVLEAPSHPDPYPWYAALRSGHPTGLFFDDTLRLWIACGDAVVAEALRHPALRVRPTAEPVPTALVGSATGRVFGLLVRMNDGAFHADHRPAVMQRVASLHGAAEAAQAAAADLFDRVDANRWLSEVPVQAMARLLGVPAQQRDATVAHVHAFVRGIGPGASSEELQASDRAAGFLMAQGEAEALSDAAAANRIALMQQSLDATAGLIGNALARLARDARAIDEGFVRDVAQTDPAVHNTRRWAADDLTLAGTRIAAGAGLVLLLALAQRPFGAGRHECPGTQLALTIATGALRFVQAEPARLARFRALRGYRPLPNARIPIFVD